MLSLAKKANSRKFLVWVVSCVYVGLAYALYPEVLPVAYNWWGTISVIYIGGNVATSFIKNKGIPEQ